MSQDKSRQVKSSQVKSSQVKSIQEASLRQPGILGSFCLPPPPVCVTLSTCTVLFIANQILRKVTVLKDVHNINNLLYHVLTAEDPEPDARPAYNPRMF
mgnify:FL=1